MLINFSVRNFRSIRDEVTISLEGTASRLKENNTIPTENNLHPKLLKAALIYGGNAVGKTNIIRSFFTMQRFIANSTQLNNGDKIPKKYYNPFLLDDATSIGATYFKVEFIGTDDKKYIYTIEYNEKRILNEFLGVFETSKLSMLFERKEGAEIVEIGEKFVDQKVERKVLYNRLFLSQTGNSPDRQIGAIYTYFKNISIWNAVDGATNNIFKNAVQEIYSDPTNNDLLKKFNKLLRIADTKIDKIFIKRRDDSEFKIPGDVPEAEKKRFIQRYRYQTLSTHSYINSNKELVEKQFDFMADESHGTQLMFTIGGTMLAILESEKPGILFIDEFNNSLHPSWVKFLLEMFQHPLVNRNGSQLIIATHETALLDKDVLRKDQIWFAGKDSSGSTSLTCMSDYNDIDNLRETVPFEKWYRMGKFGGLPNIRKSEFFADYES